MGCIWFSVAVAAEVKIDRRDFLSVRFGGNQPKYRGEDQESSGYEPFSNNTSSSERLRLRHRLRTG